MENTAKSETNEIEKLKEVVHQIINLIKETASAIIKLVTKAINSMYRLYNFNKKYSKIVRLACHKKNRIAKKNRKRLVKLINNEHLFEDGEKGE